MVSLSRTLCLGLFVLATIGFLSGSAWAEQKAQPEQRAAAAEKADPAPPPPPAKRLAPEKAEPYKPACSAPKDQGEKDLCESVRANDLAAKNLYWVRIGTGAVLLSLIFTGWAAWAAAIAANAARKSVEHAEADASEQAERFGHQLHVARASADAAASGARATRSLAVAGQRSAEAAAKQAEIADEAARKQLRAYVGAQAINYTFSRENGAFAVCVEIKNFGQTPAFNFRLLGSLNYIDFPIKEPPSIGPCFDDTHTLFPTMITYVTNNLPASEERIMHLRSGRGGFLSTVLLEYTDHQGIMHSETIRSYVTGNPALDRFGATHTATMTFWRGEST